MVSLIAVLVALLLPALQSARDSAKTITCAGNLHQLGPGWLLAVDEHRGRVPPVRDNPIAGQRWWWAAIGKALELPDIVPSRERGAFACPAVESRATPIYGNPKVGYSVNALWFEGEPLGSAGGQVWERGGMASDYPLFADAELLSFADGTHTITSSNIGLDYAPFLTRGVGFHHAGTARVAFGDGHVAAVGVVELEDNPGFFYVD